MTQQSLKTVGQTTPTTQQTCSVDGCGSRANRVKFGLCEKHYMRLRRNGTTDRTLKPPRIKHSAGYVLVAPKDHPLMQGKPSGSRIYEHRMVFFDKYGGGKQKCYWCGKTILFEDMHVDHLNAVKHDNRIDNLVAACPSCNQARGIQKMTETMRQRGLMLTYNGETKHVSQWVSDLGISSVSLKYRMKNGWSIKDAVTKPRGKFGPKGAK
jgi:5-methylcytosine-specific restriction endonuclease McrA